MPLPRVSLASPGAKRKLLKGARINQEPNICPVSCTVMAKTVRNASAEWETMPQRKKPKVQSAVGAILKKRFIMSPFGIYRNCMKKETKK